MALTRLLPITAESYRPHPLHSAERIWTETNCYVDIWIEVLHALGVEPTAMCSFALETDFEGDQWTFFKPPTEDMRTLYGVNVFEMNPWRPLVDHVVEHLTSGRLITFEADAWYLPDTKGVSYRIDHTKTTVVPNLVDPGERRLGYFHNAGYFELNGDDFDGVFRLGETTQVGTLPPYVETVRVDRLITLQSAELQERSIAIFRQHLARLPESNPILRFAKSLTKDLEWLRTAGVASFHLYAFGTFRQCGASAEIGAAFVEWLADQMGNPEDLQGAAQSLRTIAQTCKAAEFSLARVARGRNADFTAAFDTMSAAWDNATTLLRQRYAC